MDGGGGGVTRPPSFRSEVEARRVSLHGQELVGSSHFVVIRWRHQLQQQHNAKDHQIMRGC